MDKLVRGISDDVASAMQFLADQHKRSFNSEVVWALEQYVKSERKTQPMQYDNRDGNYHGFIGNTEIIVDGDVYAEQEQAGVSEKELQSPLTWENNADGESVRIVSR